MPLEEICPRLLWRIDKFSTIASRKSSSFRYLNADWQWEYVHHDDHLSGSPVMKSVIFLTRLSPVCACKQVKRFLSFVYIKNPAGKKAFEQMYTFDMDPRNRWIVFEVEKESIVEKELIWNDSCIFSCSLEPLGTYEEIASLETESRPSVTGIHNYPELQGGSSTPPCLQSLSSDFGKLLTDPAFTDVTLKCGDTSFPAHRCVLVSRSEKFADLLGSKDVSKHKPIELVHIEDIQPEVLHLLIGYIYTSSVRMTIALAEEIYRASNEYGVESLTKESALFIMENLKSFDPRDILLLAEEYRDSYLKGAVASHIANDLTILASEEWKNFTDNHKMLAIEVFRIFVQRSHLRS